MTSFMKWTFILICILIPFTSVFAETNPNDNQPLFPLYGITLGLTTTDELAKMGIISSQHSYYTVNSVNFWYKNNVANFISINSMKKMPDDWDRLGFSWVLSYNDWISLLHKLGYTIRITQTPFMKINDYDDFKFYYPQPSYQAEFEAYKPSAYPTVLKFFFSGTGRVNPSLMVAFNITATFKPDLTEFKEQLYFNNPETVTLTGEQRKALAYSGILMEINQAYHERLEPGDMVSENVQQEKALLIRDWGINNREELLKMLDSLDKEGHSQKYKDMAKILKDNPKLTEAEIGIKYKYEDYIVKRLFFVKKMQGVIGDRSLRAWDLGRSIALCRWGYQVGFLSSTEAWDRIMKIAEKIKSLYYSWEDYAANYILGRGFWSSGNAKEFEYINGALKAYFKLINTGGTAWQLPWGDGIQV